MTARHRVPLACGAALALLIVTAAAAAAPGPACRAEPCEGELIVSPEPGLFRSEEAFDSRREQLGVWLLVGGAELSTVRRYGRRGCRRDLRGPGIRATTDVCGREGPLEVRAHRIWGGSMALRIRYRARRRPAQGVRGISASSQEGGIGSLGSGGVTPP